MGFWGFGVMLTLLLLLFLTDRGSGRLIKLELDCFLRQHLLVQWDHGCLSIVRKGLHLWLP